MSHAEIRRDQLREMKCEPEPGMLKEGVLHGEDIQILKSADERGGEDNLMEAIFVLMVEMTREEIESGDRNVLRWRRLFLSVQMR